MVNGVQSALACSLFIQFHSNNDFDKRCVHHAKNECSFKYQHFRGENNGRKKNSIFIVYKSILVSIRIETYIQRRERKSEKNACCTIDDDEQQHVCVCVCMFGNIVIRGMKIVDRALLSISGVRGDYNILCLYVYELPKCKTVIANSQYEGAFARTSKHYNAQNPCRDTISGSAHVVV